MKPFIVLEDGPHKGLYRFNSISVAKAWIKKRQIENLDYKYFLYKYIG